MRRSKRLMAFLMSVMMVVSLVFNGQLSGGYMVYAEEEVASDTDAAEMTEDATGDCEENVQDVVSTETEMSDANFDNSTYVGDNYEVTLTLDSYWDSGYNATITIKNTGDTVIENWCVAFPLEQNISNIWNANIEEVHEDYFVIKNAGWNQDIAVGGSVSFGITCYEAFSVYPEYYTLLGNVVELASGDYSVAYEITEDWGEGYKALVTITNNKSVALEDWRIKFNYGDNVITQIWDAVIVNNTDGVYEISCESYNQNIAVGGSVSFEFLVEPGSSDAEITEILVSEFISGGQFGSEDDISEPSDEMLFIYTILGIDTDELELYMLPSVDCYSYEIYSAVDGNEYKLVDTISEDSYMYLLDSSFAKIKMYVRGYYNKGEYVDSKEIVVEYIDGEYVIILSDTDGDGLDDSYELLFTATDPFLIDTDGNGVSDSDEDLDGDGLSNILEYEYGSLPYDVDSDNDDLSDYEEIYVYYTDPVNEDSDREGLLDGEDIALGFDPNLQDTDADGVLDCDERIMQSYTYDIVDDEKKEILSVSVELECNGLLENNVYVENMYNLDVQSSNVVGLVGVPVEIQVDSEFDTAKITFAYDDDMLGDTPEENLCMMWYDEANNRYVLLGDCEVDMRHNVVVYETAHFSTYMLVDKEVWCDTWEEEECYNNQDNHENYEIMFVIDASYNLSTTGVLDAEKNSICRFIDALEKDDMCGYVALTKMPSGTKLRYDKGGVKKAIKSIRTRTGHIKTDALRNCLTKFQYDSDTKKIIVIVTQGECGLYEDAIEAINDEGIMVHCVKIYNNNDMDDIMQISSTTEGNFYLASDAIDLDEELDKLLEDLNRSPDTTDTDGDGIYDIYEIKGTKSVNGQLIFSDPNLKDTDGDGISDFDELGGLPDREVMYIFDQAWYRTINNAFGNPEKTDTDGDGIEDQEDAQPQNKLMLESVGLENEDFLKIYTQVNPLEYSYGGDQGWWYGEDSTIKEYGCGAIAMTNVELYLSMHNEDFYDEDIYRLLASDRFSYSYYKQYVNERINEVYEVDYLTIKGTRPDDMVHGMEEFIYDKCIGFEFGETNLSEPTDAPRENGYILNGGFEVNWFGSKKKIQAKKEIVQMLNKNVPVVASYFDIMGGGVPEVAEWLELPEVGNKIKEIVGDELNLYEISDETLLHYDEIYSHYFNITGVVKIYNCEKNRYVDYYKISSWGEELYINCDEWLDKLSYAFTNYLYIDYYYN